MVRTFGYESVVNCKDCSIEAVRSLDNIKAFVAELIEKTGMKAMGEFHSHYLPDTPEYREKGLIGWSICQFLETSSCVMHLCEDPENNTGTLYLNYFSCKKFEEHIVLELLKQYFEFDTCNNVYLVRDVDEEKFF